MSGVDVNDKIEKARVAEANGLLASALRMYRIAYYAAKPNSEDRRRCMESMIRLRRKGAEGYLPGDRLTNYPAHMQERPS